jgi:hypothetical protein
VKHFLAYGNSDQVSFRHPEVRGAFDFMLVPGTIAAYYADATAAFVLSSDLEYVIEPRTPLFQGRIPEPKASHFALAGHMGTTVKSHMGDESLRLPVEFSRALFTEEVVQELVDAVVAFQRNYGGRAPEIESKLARYRRLLAEALRTPEAQEPQSGVRGPSYVLAPYFAVSSTDDPWWQINLQIWEACSSLETPSDISPVVAVGSAQTLAATVALFPVELSPTAFFWVAGLDERTAPERELTLLWEAVRSQPESRHLVNLYGGFFSICLGLAGLWGFNNGLGYSESRSWPELPSTGAAPPRYYLRELHMFVPPAVAQLIVDADSSLACPCAVCAPGGGRTSSLVSLSYHDLKRHFVLARRWELDLVESNGPGEIADRLEDFASRLETLRETLPTRVRIEVGFLRRWARVLRGSGG